MIKRVKFKLLIQACLVAQLVKNLPAMQETLVQFLDWEDPLEKGKATIPVFWAGEYRPWDHKELDMVEQPSLSGNFFFFLQYIYLTRGLIYKYEYVRNSYKSVRKRGYLNVQ